MIICIFDVSTKNVAPLLSLADTELKYPLGMAWIGMKWHGSHQWNICESKTAEKTKKGKEGCSMKELWLGHWVRFSFHGCLFWKYKSSSVLWETERESCAAWWPGTRGETISFLLHSSVHRSVSVCNFIRSVDMNGLPFLHSAVLFYFHSVVEQEEIAII